MTIIKYTLPKELQSFKNWCEKAGNSSFGIFVKHPAIYATCKLRFIAAELNGDWIPERDRPQWCIKFLDGLIKFRTTHYTGGTEKILFKDEKIMEEACNLMADDIWRYFGVKI
jgi:hypothetical protein